MILSFNYSIETFTKEAAGATFKINWSKANYSEISNDFSLIEWEDLFNNMGANECYNSLLDIIEASCKRHVPLINIKSPNINPPWMTNQLKTAIRDKNLHLDATK